MPTLEVQLAKARKDLAALEEWRTTWQINSWDYSSPKLVEQMHGNDVKRRGLIERIRYLQVRISRRSNETEGEPLYLQLHRLGSPSLHP
jgi:hypothetical protein